MAIKLGKYMGAVVIWGEDNPVAGIVLSNHNNGRKSKRGYQLGLRTASGIL